VRLGGVAGKISVMEESLIDMDYNTSMRQMGHGSHFRKERGRLSDFWEVAKGCAIGCDDSHSQDGVETILVPETLWSDLPAVHVGLEWEPVDGPQPQCLSGSLSSSTAAPFLGDAAASKKESAPRSMALRWDTTAEDEIAPESTAVRDFEEWEIQERWKNGSTGKHEEDYVFRVPHDEEGQASSTDNILSLSSHRSLGAHASPSYSSEGQRCEQQQLSPVAPKGGRYPMTTAHGLHRLPVSKGGDVACLPPELTDLHFSWPMGEAVSCSISALSSMSMSSISCLPKQCQRPCAPMKRRMDFEVVDIDDPTFHHPQAKANGQPCHELEADPDALSYPPAAEATDTSAASTASASKAPRPPNASADVGRGRLSDQPAASSSSAGSPAVSKAEAGGGRPSRLSTEQDSTNASDLGGDADARDDASPSERSVASVSSSSASGREASPNGAPRPPECVAKLLFGRQATNRIVSRALATKPVTAPAPCRRGPKENLGVPDAKVMPNSEDELDI